MAPSHEDRVKALKKKRIAFKIELQELSDTLDISPRVNNREISIRLENLETEYASFAKNQPDLDTLDDTDELLRERLQLKSFYSQVKARALEITSPLIDPRSSLQTPISHADTSDSEIQLPKITLPSFSGNHDNWPSFASQFKSAVHDNIRINDCKKLTYLRSCVKGEALQAIESLSSSADSYAAAWQILEKRYNQPAVIVANHVRALFDAPSITRPTHRELRTFLNNIEAHYRSLQILQQPTVDTLLIHLLLTKIDKETTSKWREYTRNDAFPTIETLFEFLNERLKIVEPFNITNTHHNNNTNNQSWRGQLPQRTPPRPNIQYSRTSPQQVLTTQVVASCIFCTGKHCAQQCERFCRLSIPERYKLIESKRLCSNCLRPNHSTEACRSTTCRRCHKKHHTLLHVDAATSPKNDIHSLNSCLDITIPSEVFFATAVVTITDNSGQTRPCRVLLDSCSHANFLTRKFIQGLDLTHQRVDIPLSGANNMSSRITSQTTAKINSRTTTYTKNLSFFILNKVSQEIPTQTLDRNTLDIPHNIPLADPQFHKSAEIDGLLGAQTFWELLCIGRIRLSKEDMHLCKTKLGWVVVGETMSSRTGTVCNVINTSLEGQITKFWELEDRTPRRHLSPEESACESHYLKHTRREAGSGRYIVNLPFKDNIHNLGNSYQMAYKRFLTLERQLDRNPEVKKEYHQFLSEYENLGHMTLRTANHSDGYFLPHHAVLKSDSLTTKIRVVFDASATTTSGLSLNNTLMVGPTIQDDLFTIVLRFRTHQYVLTADITKMYRQIKLAEEDRKFHKILWRKHRTHPIQIFELNTVTYGTASAPFLATRTLHQLARDEGHAFPIAARTLESDFYVDDMLTGASTFRDAEILRDQLIALTAKGGLQLRQWASNNPELLTPLQTSQEEHMTLNLTDTKKTLGLFWKPQNDTIGYTVKKRDPLLRNTKRTILSRIAQLFDPLGLLGPVVLKAKLIMQELWKQTLHWDESVPMDIHSRWNTFQEQLPLIENFTVHRNIIGADASNIQLHGFADASERAYGACFYLRSTKANGETIVQLICSKSRVSPLKTQSLPRLELCAAVLLIHLYKSLTSALNLKYNMITFWTDSMIVLHWIRTPPHTLKQFVANRVSEIQEQSDASQWRHIPSLDNPADILSRGTNPAEFLRSTLWSNGPSWLTSNDSQWPPTNLPVLEIPEIRPITALHITTQLSEPCELIRKFSSFTLLIRVTAYVYRFYNNTRKGPKRTGQLTTDELEQAHNHLIKIAQREAFPTEISLLGQVDGKPYKGRLVALRPFLDETGLIRVGGRLLNADLTYDHKHPFLLPNNHPITNLIIRHHHSNQAHAGTLATLNAIRQRYWPINGKTRVKTIIRQCITCFRARPRIPDYPMGNLPKPRVTLTRPFLTTGIDYCGPFFIKERRFRNIKKIKCYVSVFICLSTKAIHLELVSDLTTNAFLAALRRFFARRGKATDIYSDNGSNFVGANREMKEVHKILMSEIHNEIIHHHLANDKINWHFIPPRAPHFGGIWEAAVKSFKTHTLKLLRNTLLTYEAFTTCLTEIEAILNSRPLTPLSSDPTDLTALTPAHFLTGDSLTSMPERDLSDTKAGRLSCWQQTQQIKQHFWTRWHKEYLNELTVRQKWHNPQALKITEGRLVVVKEDNLPPLYWPLGRIVNIHPGADGTTRVLTVKTAHGTYRRPMKKVAPLPIDDT